MITALTNRAVKAAIAVLQKGDAVANAAAKATSRACGGAPRLGYQRLHVLLRREG